MRRLLRLILTVLPWWVCHGISAHEMRPAFLEVVETSKDTYDVVWKVPEKKEGLQLVLDVRFADDVSVITEPVGGLLGGAYVKRWQIKREGGLGGTEIVIDGLS